MSTTSIYEVCAKMEREGFTYGALITPGAFKRLEGASEKLKMSVRKPEDALYFSKIDVSWHSVPDGEDVPEDSTEGMAKTLQWQEWIVDEAFFVDDYKKRDILFTKFDESKIILNSSERFAKDGDCHMHRGPLSCPNWHKVGMVYDGINVDRCNTGYNQIFDAWDVDTVCIWHADVITELRWFENSGEDWTYDVLSVNF